MNIRYPIYEGVYRILTKKIPERSEDDFLLANQLLKGAALRNQRGKGLSLRVRK